MWHDTFTHAHQARVLDEAVRANQRRQVLTYFFEAW